MAAWHRFLDHTSEVELQVGAEDFAGLLAEAARALAELLLRGAPAVPEGAPRRLEVEAHDREALLVDWLNEILYRAEVELWAPVEIAVDLPSPMRLVARVRGAPLAGASSAVKAATLHGLAIRDLPGGVEAEVILDV